ncbi:hypothetical protein AYI69_g7695 [Smittium culicis]|uniref:Uncharacterized protein n=1 Tax=Smittium culicis TaxID=133412 RepID=A0A1R1XQ57_9FUNG|nr:hypothetical protein AYI69_g7695 [Smittium culicis]
MTRRCAPLLEDTAAPTPYCTAYPACRLLSARSAAASIARRKTISILTGSWSPPAPSSPSSERARSALELSLHHFP